MKRILFLIFAGIPMLAFSAALTILRIASGRLYHGGCRICPCASPA
jgi:hypothetical protein